MVVGVDVDIGEILDLLGREKIGWFFGMIVSPISLHKWMDENWSILLGYRTEFHALTRGLICFKFRSKEDIFSRVWVGALLA
jgi:hypothetical protein